MKKILIPAAVFLLLAGTVVIQHKWLAAARREVRGLEAGVVALMDTARSYRVRDSLWAAWTAVLELRAADYARLRAEDARLLADLRIRLRRAESVAKSATETRLHWALPLRDTVIVAAATPASAPSSDTARRFDYRTPHVELTGVVRADTVEVSLLCRDTLRQIVHRVPRRLWFIRYGTRAIRQEVVSSNPHTRVTYTEYIEIR